jgi:hypothetical protein
MSSLNIRIASALILAIIAFAEPAAGQVPIYDYGDAPETNSPYPWIIGVPGRFPTCEGGPSAMVRHRVLPGFPNLFYFGPNYDLETDGNGGSCIQPPYEMDECYGAADGDAGLTIPDGYSIINDAPVSCGAINPRPLAEVCAMWGTWGTDIDILVNNDKGDHVYINVLVDWDQSGSWGGQSQCGSMPVPERIVENLPIPAFFHGLLSQSSPPPPQFIIGPNSGYVWVRFTISPDPIASGDPFFDGSGPLNPPPDTYTWENGETEDYLLRVNEPQPFGACCFPDGHCQITSSEAQCDSLGGVQFVLGELCQPNPCQLTPTEYPTWGRLKALYR